MLYGSVTLKITETDEPLRHRPKMPQKNTSIRNKMATDSTNENKLETARINNLRSGGEN